MARATFSLLSFLCLALSASARRALIDPRSRRLSTSTTSPAPTRHICYMQGVTRTRDVTVESSASAVTTLAATDAAQPDDSSSPNKPTGQAQTISWPAGDAGPVTYHGGSLLTSPIVVHIVYYGNWPANSGQSSIEGFIKSLSDSSADSKGPSVHKWWDILTAYTDSNGDTISSKVSMGKTVTVGGNYRTQLGDGSNGGSDDIQKIITQQIGDGKLPLDGNAFYLLVSSADVKVGDASSGFCAVYCGWHTQTTVSGTPIAYSFVGDASEQCNNGCGANGGLSSTPNGFFGADSLISVVAHELSEASSNPDTQTGYWAAGKDGTEAGEIGDLCNGQYTDSEHPDLLYNSAQTYAYNLVGVDGLKFLVQTNVNIKKQECVLQGSPAAGTTTPPSGQSPPPASESSPPPPDSPVGDSPPPPDVTVGDAPPPADVPVGDTPPPSYVPVGGAPTPSEGFIDFPPPPDFTVPPPDSAISDTFGPSPDSGGGNPPESGC